MACNKPLWLKSKELFVPCGQCLGCRKQRAKEWSIRLNWENFMQKKSVFVTLTYDETKLLNPSLNKSDLQKFIKRVRKHYKDVSIKYFAVGEYGSKSLRKHYHLIMFGIDATSHRVLQEKWQNGFVQVGTVQPHSIAYTCGYVNKKLYGKAKEEYMELGLEPPFMVCSQKLGLDYVKEYYQEFIDTFEITMNGCKYPIPRYFRKLLGIETSYNESYKKYIEDLCEKSINDIYEDQKTNKTYSFDEYITRREELSRSMPSSIPFKKLHNILTYNAHKERELITKNRIFNGDKI